MELRPDHEGGFTMLAHIKALHAETRSLYSLPRRCVRLPLIAMLALLVAGLCLGQAAGEQTRDQCNTCCGKQGHDEYYLEQCRLKCFRNPDHCAEKRTESKTPPAEGPTARRPPVRQPSPEQEMAQQPAARPPAMQPPAVQRPPMQQAPMQQPPMVRQPVQQQPMLQQPPPQQQEERRASRRSPFQWPHPLNLEPGKEWQAASQILMLNGIPPDHPNYQRALKGVESVLVQFARSNPQGGQLPTTELEKMIRQNR
jgi:FtsZ-interacting cell division protein ZipA